MLPCLSVIGASTDRPCWKNWGKLGLMTFTATKVWNQDDGLTRMYIFEYESPEAVKACLPVWKDIEKLVFSGVSMKVTAYRGVRQESWSRT